MRGVPSKRIKVRYDPLRLEANY